MVVLILQWLIRIVINWSVVSLSIGIIAITTLIEVINSVLNIVIVKVILVELIQMCTADFVLDFLMLFAKK